MTLAIRERFELPQDRKALEAAAAIALQYCAQRVGYGVQPPGQLSADAAHDLCDDLFPDAPACGLLEVDWRQTVARMMVRLAKFNYVGKLAEFELDWQAKMAELAQISDALALDQLNRDLRERREKEGR